MNFGIWVEPEMISEDSDLYRAHHDWSLTLPGRDPAMGRDSWCWIWAAPKCDYLTQVLSDAARNHHIDIKMGHEPQHVRRIQPRPAPRAPGRSGPPLHAGRLPAAGTADHRLPPCAV
jgi:alpha-galactosidase